MASESDPLLRHWFRVTGGDPEDMNDPWGLWRYAVQQTNPTLFNYRFETNGGGCDYVVEFEGSNDVGACDVAASDFKDELQKAGFTVVWSKRETITNLADIVV